MELWMIHLQVRKKFVTMLHKMSHFIDVLKHKVMLAKLGETEDSIQWNSRSESFLITMQRVIHELNNFQMEFS